MTKFFLLLSIISTFVHTSATAENTGGAAANAPREENRFLFVIETSLPMNRMSKATIETVRALVGSGVQGQMHAGDTFGLWTFNEELNTDFPMQQWTPGASEKLAQGSADFLKKRRFEKKAVLQHVLDPLFPILKSSKAITVVFVSTGNDPMRGSPFDQEINAIYPIYANELREAKIPFVTVLVGRSGKVVAYSVNSSLGPIKIPNPPIEPSPVVTRPVTNSPAVATNTVAKPKPIVPNIIMTKPTATNSVADVLPQKTNLAEKVEAAIAVVKPNVTTFTAVPTSSVAIVESNLKLSTTNPVLKSQTSFVTPTSPGGGTESLAANEMPAPSKTMTPQKAEVPAAVSNGEDARKIANVSRDDSAARKAGPTSNALAATPGKNSTEPLTQVAAKTVSKPKSIFVSLALVLLVCVATIFVVMRRSQNKSHSSLISQSMHQRK